MSSIEFVVNSTTILNRIDFLHQIWIFARFRIPKLVVSDNGPQFRSNEFRVFRRQNKIELKSTPSYHPAGNGAAENAVWSVKSELQKIHSL